VIVLPADARAWDADLRRAIVHELEHVTRGDWAVHMAARAVCAAYWLHPLV
jgi:beta-lactamase regulating signal transducer with metallopeptidase domain